MSTELVLSDVFGRLVSVQAELWNAVDTELRADHGVPLTQLTVLQVVASTPSCRVQDLVSMLHISVGGASKVVDRLVAADLVSRKANPSDRRSSVLAPTRTGRALLRKAQPDIEALLEDLLGARLTAAELTRLSRLLDKLQSPRPATITQNGA